MQPTTIWIIYTLMFGYPVRTRCPVFGLDSRRRRDDRLGASRGYRQGREFRQGTRSRSVAWSSSEAIDNWWETEAFRDQQARQQIPLKIAHPWRSLGAAIYRGA